MKKGIGIKAKMLLAFLVVSSFILVAGHFGQGATREIIDDSEVMTRDYAPLVISLSKIRSFSGELWGETVSIAFLASDSSRRSEASESAIDDSDQRLIEEEIGELEKTKNQLDLWVDEFSKAARNDEEKKLAGDIKSLVASQYSSSRALIDAVQEQNNIDLVASLGKRAEDREETVRVLIENAQESKIAEFEGFRARSQEVIDRNWRLIFFLYVMATASAVLVGLFLSTAITRDVRKVRDTAEKIADGDLDQRIEIASGDEIGQLGQAFNKMARKLKELYKGLERKVRERTRNLEQAKVKDEAILASIGDGVIAVDERGRVMFTNRVAKSGLGFRGYAKGKRFSELAAMENEAGELISEKNRPITRALRTKRRVTTLVASPYFYVRRDGSRFPVAVTVAPVVLDGKLIGAIEVFRDITKEREVDKAKTEFVSLASHQLRTPLSTISWYAEMLLTGDTGALKKQQQKYLEQIYHSNKRMIELVNALLNVSRIEMGTFVIEPEPTDIAALLRSVIDELRPVVKEKHLQLKQSFEKIPTIQADPKLTRIVIQNILSNAVKYTPENGEVEVRALKKLRGQAVDGRKVGKDSIVIAVADTGYGIPKNQQGKIFEKLFRADNVRERDTDGTGLGLYIVKSILKHSGGDVWFKSEEGKGSTFYVLIPLKGMKRKRGIKKLS